MPTPESYAVDCLVIGGGIAGAGVARDATIRGLRTLLIEQHDFASGTSHVTSKLIHGGLRYLDQGKLRLAVESVVERDRLLHRLAPGLVVPQRFIIPFEGRRLLKWLLTAAGIQTYGLIELCRSGRLSRPILGGTIRAAHPELLAHPFGVRFWDARTNDARLVMAVLRSAQARGAMTWNYVTATGARRVADGWKLELLVNDRTVTVHAHAIVNATGPWSALTASFLGIYEVSPDWIKGSHLVVRRSGGFPDDVVVIRSIRDGRYLWIVPWETRLVVGTTERRFEGDLQLVRPEADELDDLWGSLLHYFPSTRFTRSDICGSYAGVRPIAPQHRSNANEMSRRHRILVNREERVVTIMGGKLTTFRLAAEEAVDCVETILDRPPLSRERRRALRYMPLWPGLNSKEQSTRITELLAAGIGGMRPDIAEHLITHYGTAVLELRRPARGSTVCAPLEGLPYTIEELEYICRTERVHHLTDLLKRRTSLLFLAEQGGLEAVQPHQSRLAEALGWSRQKFEREVEHALAELREFQSCRAPCHDA
ncbi:MAG: glycerol-3-phosphate dehydrogenase/oxidase [Phycisphaerae bacterium]|nr:glycerol-3-phosphate dehydrogenase/oxidase [Phycisphaerae bacterium]